MTNILLTGIPAAGKTTILQEILKACPFVKHINYGDVMLQEAAAQHISRDALRKLPFSKQQEIGLSAAKTIATQTKGILLIDTHAMIKTPTGFCPGIPQKILQILHPHAIVAIESDPAIIHERRHRDNSRSRDRETIEEIAHHQALNRAFLAACSALTGSLLIFINNNTSPHEAAHPLIQTIKNILIE